MISDTPRTDQQNDDLLNSDSYTSWLEMSGFARKLERELNSANEHIKLLKSSGNELLEWVKDGTISDSNYRLLANAWQRAKENKP
jgi:hypothetical protein